VTAAFRQRRKMMRQSLKELLQQENLELQEHWSTKRPEELTPKEFLQIARELYVGQLPSDQARLSTGNASSSIPQGREKGRYARDQKKDTWRGALGTMKEK
jgi:hypothetical protein